MEIQHPKFENNRHGLTESVYDAPPSPGLNEALFPNKSIEPHTPKGLEHVNITECILFGSRRKLRKVQNFGIECNGLFIQAQTSVKYLGVNLDNFLSGRQLRTASFTRLTQG